MSRENRSLWFDHTEAKPYGKLVHDTEVDVAIVGGGLTGMTAALLLATAGRQVLLVEKASIGAGETGRTTAHLTEAIDSRFPQLRRNFGKDGARLAAAASRDAIDLIARYVTELSIDCAFKRVPAYLYTERAADLDSLREEAEAASEAGVKASFVAEVPLPFIVQGAVRYENQAQFHPGRYLVALSEEFVRRGGTIVEETTVREIHDGEPCTIVTDGPTIRAREVIVAANVPVNNRLFLHTKLAAYRTYAIASVVSDDFLPAGLYWDTEAPYHYIRTQPIDGKNYLIIGGNDHKTGTKKDTEESYESLIQYARNRFAITAVDHRWSGQIIEPVDGLAFIGRNSSSKHLYISTGYGGQGMTFGTLGGMITSDLVLGKSNPYASLFDATRIKPLASAIDYVSENVDFPKYFLSQHLTSHEIEGKEPAEVAAGEGKILKLDGRKVAAFRSEDGELHLLSPVCPHLGCDVAFNEAERTWDCPCHGSRFTGEGAVINGPSTKDLSPIK
jgi:glycine/D-amino acid oxidase-like deaminating enzyme/nitrite reductase/ring-hydroxylating ferredoxin subunit